MAILDVLSCIAPEFDDVDSGVLTCIIQLAENQISESVFSTDYELAVAYLAAHMLTKRAGSGAAGGTATQKRTGDLQIMYATPVEIDKSSLNDTTYGREYLRIESLHVIGVVCAS